MPSSNPFVVLNPEAGGGRGRRDWIKIKARLREKIGPFSFEETQSAGHARSLASMAAKSGYSPVIACGGDGTLHEVVNGLKEVSPPPLLGILSMGTGGDFARTLALPRRLADQMEVLGRQKTRRLDLGSVTFMNLQGKRESRFFINAADAGLGAEVVRRRDRFRRLFGRRLSYLTSTLCSYTAWRPRKIFITADEREINTQSEISCVVVANGRYFGGGMQVAPRASPNDGALDLVVSGRLNPIMLLWALPLLYLKHLDRHPSISFDRARKITLRSEEPVCLEIDGEFAGSLPAAFEIVPQALSVIVP